MVVDLSDIAWAMICKGGMCRGFKILIELLLPHMIQLVNKLM